MWSRGLTAPGRVVSHLRPSERWGPVTVQERTLPPAPRAAAWKPVLRAGAQGLRTREENSLRRSGRGEEVVSQQDKNRVKDLAETRPGLAEKTE